ncbi:MAG: adenosylcobyric acid [Geobacteraceae bacterium]|nr:MAG: adenosylcobyric acid [Geobacteraceae bacterium]
MSKLYVVGIGPGDLKHMTFEAREAIESAQVVVGYKTYLELIKPLLAGKEVVSSGMTKEVDRCREALGIASSGKTVALISSGDAGVYGMAGLVLELAGAGPRACPDVGTHMGVPLQSVDIIVVPGVSAVQAAASVLGAPLMHDFAVISLSDLLTPWDAIERRLAAAAAADFVVALYNPRSKGRVRHLEDAQRIMLSVRSATTPVGIVRNACRKGEEKVVTTLADMLSHPVDMFSIVIIGNSATFVNGKGRLVTPRGYAARSEELGVRSEEKKRSLPLTPHPSPLTHQGKALMFCGTASDVGKSVLTSGFCRILKNRGISVAPFKSQNMALNSAVTPEGREIGRAQAVQAEACGIPSHTDMNPVLLKPNSDTGSQVIVQGKVVRNMTVKEYNAFKPEAFVKVRESFERLASRFDFIVIEGAGSIAEINLKAHDIANLKVAEMAGSPVILVADIDRGGVFAQIVGTMELLEPFERARVKGIIINKFRGDASLLGPGIEFVEKRTGVPVLGVVPCFSGFRIPEEDSVALEKRGKREAGSGKRNGGKISIGVVKLPRISNYTDFDPLEAEPDVALSYVGGPGELAGLDVLILPGSKSTTADLYFLMERGLFDAIKVFSGPVVGICGGYQMMGNLVMDPDGVESAIKTAQGLGLLDVATVMLPDKETHLVAASLLEAGLLVAPGWGKEMTGYEIHMGETSLGRGARPFARISRRSGSAVEVTDGAVSSDGRVFGTYLHGIFDNEGFRSAFLNRIRRSKGISTVTQAVPREDPFDLLAQHLENHLDMERIFTICGITG